MAVPDWNWMRRAACRGEDLELFFGIPGEDQLDKDIREGEAKKICSWCPVRSDCASHALSKPERAGIWGGLNEHQRDAERRRRQRRGIPVATAATKLCTQCDTTKPIANFGKDKLKKDGLNLWCRDCTNAVARQRRREAKEAMAS